MAVKIPVVISTTGPGTFQQLQSGDTLAGVTAGPQKTSGTFGGTGGNAGNPLYLSGVNIYQPALANALSTSLVLGFSDSSGGLGAAVGCQIDGVFTLTTAAWDTLTGGAGGLTAGSIYWLSPTTAGHITTTKPTTAGQVAVQVGVALSTTDMLVLPGTPVLL